jgi:hypothetical protein
MKLTEILIGLAATKRFVNLVTEDEITRPVREKVARRFPDSKVNYLLNCPYCVGVWGGFLIMSPYTPPYVRNALAMAGLSDLVLWARGVVESKVK